MEQQPTPEMGAPVEQPPQDLQPETPRVLLAIVLLLTALVAVLGYMVFERIEEREEMLLEMVEIDAFDDSTDDILPLVEEEDSYIEDEMETRQAPLFFSTMTHLEGNWNLATVAEDFFDRQAVYLRTAYAYAQEYDAKITIESEIPMALGMEKWGDNLLQEAVDLGLGVGTHCDTTPTAKFTDAELTAEIAERKAAVDALVDPSENLGCAGAGGFGDWYEGMVGAGFKYIDGLVGFHYLAMNPSDLPDGWDVRSILNEHFHDHAPQEDDLRYYPFRISEVGFTPDAEGDLVVSAGDVGQITAIEESLGTGTWDGGCDGDCPFTEADVDALVEFIREFNETRDVTRVAKLQVYIPTQVYEDPMIDYFFQEMQKLQDQGVMEWATQKEVYEAFVAWEEA